MYMLKLRIITVESIAETFSKHMDGDCLMSIVCSFSDIQMSTYSLPVTRFALFPQQHVS